MGDDIRTHELADLHNHLVISQSRRRQVLFLQDAIQLPSFEQLHVGKGRNLCLGEREQRLIGGLLAGYN